MKWMDYIWIDKMIWECYGDFDKEIIIGYIWGDFLKIVFEELNKKYNRFMVNSLLFS